MRELKRYKEELVALVLLSLLLLAVRWLSTHYWVEPGVLDELGNVIPGKEGHLPSQYDLRSETETVSWTVLRMVIYSLFAWLGVRVTMPAAYKWLKDQFDFGKLTGEQKVQLIFRLFAIMFFGLVLLHASGAPAGTRECVLASARADLGVRELTGNNDGPRIEEYQRHVKAPLKSSWCVAMVSFHLSACGVDNPRSAWSPSYSLPKDRVWTPRKALRDPLPADVFTLYYPQLGRVGHGGLVERREGRYLHTVEGNTNGGGSRDGDGVHARRRELSKVFAITNYINDDAHRTAIRHAGTGGLQANAATGEHNRAARQRGGAVRAQGHGDLDQEGQRQRSGGTASAWARPAAGEPISERRNGHIERAQRGGRSELRLRQHGLQAAAPGQVDARDQRAQGGCEGTGYRDARAEVGVVVAGHRHPGHAYAHTPAAAHDHARLA